MVKEKIVFIRRAETFIQSANNHDEQVQEYFGMGFQAIGSAWKVWGIVPITGLTEEEQNVILPMILGWYGNLDDSRDSAEFRKLLKKFYTDINTKIPGEGIRLNCSLKDLDKPLSPKNLPINPRHYIIWKHALAHPQCGANYMEAEGNPLMKFYIDDQAAIVNAAADLNKKEDEALGLYAPLMRDFDRMEMVLVLMGVDTTDMDELEMGIKAKSMARSDDSKSNAVNLQRLNRFIDVATNRDLQIAYQISEMVRVGTLDKVGLSIVIKESGQLIGRNEREAVLWMEDPSNSQTVNVLKATYTELAKSKRRDSERVEEAVKKQALDAPSGTDNNRGIIEEAQLVEEKDSIKEKEAEVPAGPGETKDSASRSPKAKFE